MTPAVSVVVPTLGRPSLATLLDALVPQLRPEVVDVLLVDDRADPAATAALSLPPGVRAVTGPGRGPAAARNVGWRLARGRWVAFLDDDVLPPAHWVVNLLDDLAGADAGTAGSQGRIVVPLPADRRPTDWERSTAGLETAAWATADMAYRRDVLLAVGGFDERFPRAFREDADLALRVQALGWRLVRGRRHVQHPVRPAGPWISLRTQRGNADDALIRRLHGRHWATAAHAPRGRIRRHVAVTVAGAAAGMAAASGHRRLLTGLAAAWLAGTSEFAAARIAAGPRDLRETGRMLMTSVAIPPLAVGHRIAGEWRWRHGATPWPVPVRAVLFDRDGTLVRDVPYNGDPDRVVALPGARAAVDRLRAAGIRVGVVSNQSGIARGTLTAEQVAAVNRRVEELLGPFDTWQVCPHGPEESCACRKPAPGLVTAAARELGVAPWECAVVGDIGSDIAAAARAGARSVLVPTAATRPEEIAAADRIAPDLATAVSLLLAGDRAAHPAAASVPGVAA